MPPEGQEPAQPQPEEAIVPSPVENLIDHSAQLQQQVDRLNDEVLTLALAGLGLALALMLLSWKLWHEQ